MISIVLPTYNESENLPIIVSLIVDHLTKYISRFQKFIFSDVKEDFEIVIVDDNSPDNTFGIAKNLQAIYGSERIVLGFRHKKLGLGSAYIYALSLCHGDKVLFLDADLSHHVIYISYIFSQNL